MYSTDHCFYCEAPGHRLSVHSIRKRKIYDIDGPRIVTYTVDHCHDCKRFKVCQWLRYMLVGQSKITKALADEFLRQLETWPLWKVAGMYRINFGVEIPESTLHDVLTTRRMELIDEKNRLHGGATTKRR